MIDQRPNIILIITDQQRYDTINALGFPYMNTPNLDRLVLEGVTFDNCFITAPSCAPSRASLFTGYYPHVTGIVSNGTVWRHSWVEALAESGYYCVNIGKMHTTPYETPLGFHERYVVENKDRYLRNRYYFDSWDRALMARGLIKQQRELYRKLDDYTQRLGAFEWELPEDMHPDMFVGDLACWWLKSYPKSEPLFLEVGFPGPHPPYDPIPRYADPYLKRDLPQAKQDRDDLAHQPPPLKALRQHNIEVDHDSLVHLANPTGEQLHRQRAYYYANITMIDERIGRILEVLNEQGYLDNAVLIFTSDHGDHLNDHGQAQKQTMYDIITRVPLIVWSPGRMSAGVNVSELCQNMDIGRTILDFAHVPTDDAMQAQSLVPVLTRDQPWTGRDFVFAEQSVDGVYMGPYQTMVRNKDWKLVHFLDQTYGQLFNLQEDPDEMHNLWNDPAAQEKKQMLLQVLLEWRIGSGLETRNVFENYR